MGCVWYNARMAFHTRLLDALSDPALSMNELAAKLQLPIDQLALVLARPDLAQEIAALESVASIRARLVATSLLPAAAQAARRVLDDFEKEGSDCSRDTALRAIRILLRLANFTPGPVAPRPLQIKTPRNSHSEVSPRQVAAPLPNAASQPSSADTSDAQSDGIASSTSSSRAFKTAPTQSSISSSEEAGAEPRTPSLNEHGECADEELSPLEALERAVDLIRRGAFSRDQLGEVFRIAALEAGEDFASELLDGASPEILASHLESVAAEMRDSHAAELLGAPP